MVDSIKIEDLQGDYEIRYQSTPQVPNWYEPGTGVATINGKKINGTDALGCMWNGSFDLIEDNKIVYQAVIDPQNAPPHVGIVDEKGVISRAPQSYKGEMSITKTRMSLIIRTNVKRGPLSIEVQFIKRPTPCPTK